MERRIRTGIIIKYLAGAGAKSGPFGEDVPNITPDKETGIG